MPDLLQNVVLSSNPCPVCIDAGRQGPMKLEDWAASEWGLPGSSARYCEDDCHCILVPAEVLADFPAVNERVKLRGEEGTEIRAIVDIGPSEAGLKEAMDTWNATRGKLPPEIYDMALEDIAPYLRKLMGERR